MPGSRRPEPASQGLAGTTYGEAEAESRAAPENDERRPCEGRRFGEQAGRAESEGTAAQRRATSNAAEFRELDDDYVRLSFRRSWDPEVKRLRRLLRDVA